MMTSHQIKRRSLMRVSNLMKTGGQSLQTRLFRSLLLACAMAIMVCAKGKNAKSKRAKKKNRLVDDAAIKKLDEEMIESLRELASMSKKKKIETELIEQARRALTLLKPRNESLLQLEWEECEIKDLKPYNNYEDWSKHPEFQKARDEYTRIKEVKSLKRKEENNAQFKKQRVVLKNLANLNRSRNCNLIINYIAQGDFYDKDLKVTSWNKFTFVENLLKIAIDGKVKSNPLDYFIPEQRSKIHAVNVELGPKGVVTRRGFFYTTDLCPGDKYTELRTPSIKLKVGDKCEVCVGKKTKWKEATVTEVKELKGHPKLTIPARVRIENKDYSSKKNKSDLVKAHNIRGLVFKRTQQEGYKKYKATVEKKTVKVDYEPQVQIDHDAMEKEDAVISVLKAAKLKKTDRTVTTHIKKALQILTNPDGTMNNLYALWSEDPEYHDAKRSARALELAKLVNDASMIGCLLRHLSSVNQNVNFKLAMCAIQNGQHAFSTVEELVQNLPWIRSVEMTLTTLFKSDQEAALIASWAKAGTYHLEKGPPSDVGSNFSNNCGQSSVNGGSETGSPTPSENGL